MFQSPCDYTFNHFYAKVSPPPMGNFSNNQRMKGVMHWHIYVCLNVHTNPLEQMQVIIQGENASYVDNNLCTEGFLRSSWK